MMKLAKKGPRDREFNDREKELFLGHVVTWGAIIFALVLAIALVRLSASDNDAGASAPHAEPTPGEMASEHP